MPCEQLSFDFSNNCSQRAILEPATKMDLKRTKVAVKAAQHERSELGLESKTGPLMMQYEPVRCLSRRDTSTEDIR